MFFKGLGEIGFAIIGNFEDIKRIWKERFIGLKEI